MTHAVTRREVYLRGGTWNWCALGHLRGDGYAHRGREGHHLRRSRGDDLYPGRQRPGDRGRGGRPKGNIPADNLTPQKARILLMLALSGTSDPGKIRRIFATY
jgi:Glutaminase/Asparaginase C-terminal domain